MKRRNFLKILPSAALTPVVVNGLKMHPFANSKMAKVLNDCADVEGRILVLIQMKGGNDGMNTIVPIAQYDTYANLRPNIRVPDSGAESFIDLDTTVKNAHRAGLHPRMTAVKDLYDRGWVNLVQAVGYTQANQSHFKSTDIWLSGGDGTTGNSNILTGWMGRSLQAIYPDVKGVPTSDMPDPLGIQVGDPNPSLGFHTETEHQSAINLSGQDPAGFYSLVQTIGGAPIANVPDTEHGEELSYIMSVEASVSQYAQRITDVFNAGSNVLSYPSTNLANQLKTIARLIRGGSKTKVYLCSMGGFDTHSSQVIPGQEVSGTHADLMEQLSEGVYAFLADLDAMGMAEQVVACTFSEFGRCAAENGSDGTDHGTLAPMFIFGKNVKAGITGGNVDLSNLTNDNQVKNMQSDYRQVFATLLQDWLGANDYVMETSLFENYVKLPLIDTTMIADPGCYIGGAPIIIDGGFTKPAPAFTIYPNPARYTAEITYDATIESTGRLSMHSMGGNLIYAGTVPIQPGSNAFLLDVAKVPSGTYIVRLEDRNTGLAQVMKLSVVK